MDSGEGHAEESGAEGPAAENVAGPVHAEVGTDVPDQCRLDSPRDRASDVEHDKAAIGEPARARQPGNHDSQRRGETTQEHGDPTSATEQVLAALAPTSLSSARVSAGAAGPVLWLCGPTGVGKSAVGFQMFMQQLGAGRAAAFVDLDQVGFCEPAPSDDPARHRVKASNLAALWRTYRTAGAQSLVMVGPAAAESDIKRYTEALPDATFTVGRLHAQPEELTRRIMLRGEGRGWAQPGDPLRGQPTARLLDVARIAIMDDTGLEGAGVGDLRVDTTRLSVREVADTIITAAGWHSVPSCDEGLSGASR